MRGEIVIDESRCQGCGLCVLFCKRGCITLVPERLTTIGRPQAVFINKENCTACCVCAWMCPDFAIEVYKYLPSA